MGHVRQIIRFGLVGVINTLVDVTLYTVLRQAGLPIVPANIISTSVALCGSYFMNFRYTFRSEHSIARLAWFFGVTCFGLWVLQPIVIQFVEFADHAVPLLEFVERITHSHAIAFNTMPKLVATGATLVWNYLWYSLKIFQRSKPVAEDAPAGKAE